MTDLIDEANEVAQRRADEAVEASRAKLAAMPNGAPGDCADCGGHFARVVRGRCGRCRDLGGHP